MKRTVRRGRRGRKWLLRWALAALVVITLYIAALVFPQPLFAHQASIGPFRVYSDAALPSGLDSVIEEAAWRIRIMEPEAGRPGARIYLCNEPRRYRLFAFLTRKSSESLAIGLSATNSIFVSVDRVERFRETNAGVLRHTRFEGRLAEVIAHEVAHFASVRALGYRAHLAQPVWKSEGWAEYQANLATTLSDPSYDLAERIDQLLDHRYWTASPGPSRDLWEWQLLVEYLAGVEGHSLTDLIRDDLTLESARSRMMAWRGREQSLHDVERVR